MLPASMCCCARRRTLRLKHRVRMSPNDARGTFSGLVWNAKRTPPLFAVKWKQLRALSLSAPFNKECVMAAAMSRRRFVQGTVAGGAFASLGDFGFLSQLQPLSAAEAKLPSSAVQFQPDIEPLVRLLETTS